MSENYSPSLEGTPLTSGDQLDFLVASDNLMSHEELAARREMEAALDAAARELQPESPVTPEHHALDLGNMLQWARATKLNQDPASLELSSPRLRGSRPASADKDAA